MNILLIPCMVEYLHLSPESLLEMVVWLISSCLNFHVKFREIKLIQYAHCLRRRMSHISSGTLFETICG